MSINKSKEMRLTRNKQAVEVNGRVVEMFGLFPVSSSESIVTVDKGAKEDVRSRIRTANVIVIQLYPVWKTGISQIRQISGY